MAFTRMLQQHYSVMHDKHCGHDSWRQRPGTHALVNRNPCIFAGRLIVSETHKSFAFRSESLIYIRASKRQWYAGNDDSRKEKATTINS